METKVLSTGIRYTNLPESYVRPESERPRLSEVLECENVPVIDLGCKDRSQITQQIALACTFYGFFQVVATPIFTNLLLLVYFLKFPGFFDVSSPSVFCLIVLVIKYKVGLMTRLLITEFPKKQRKECSKWRMTSSGCRWRRN